MQSFVSDEGAEKVPVDRWLTRVLQQGSAVAARVRRSIIKAVLPEGLGMVGRSGGKWGSAEMLRLEVCIEN